MVSSNWYVKIPSSVSLVFAPFYSPLSARSFPLLVQDFPIAQWIEANKWLILNAGFWEEIITTFPFGLFGGIVLSAQFIGLYHCSSREDMATAISMYYMSQQIGIALGISFSSGLMKHQFKVTLQRAMMNIPGSTEVSSLPLPRKAANSFVQSTDYQENLGQFFRRHSIPTRNPVTHSPSVSWQLLDRTRLVIWYRPLFRWYQATKSFSVLTISTQILTILPMISTTEQYSNWGFTLDTLWLHLGKRRTRYKYQELKLDILWYEWCLIIFFPWGEMPLVHRS